MGEKEKLSYGKYVEQLRRSREKSLRETGKAIGVTPQFYSEVEKGRCNAFTKDRMEKLVAFLFLNEEEIRMLYVKAKEANNAALPLDCEDYAADHAFVVEALRLSKATGAGEKEWQALLDDLRARKSNGVKEEKETVKRNMFGVV